MFHKHCESILFRGNTCPISIVDKQYAKITKLDGCLKNTYYVCNNQQLDRPEMEGHRTSHFFIEESNHRTLQIANDPVSHSKRSFRGKFLMQLFSSFSISIISAVIYGVVVFGDRAARNLCPPICAFDRCLDGVKPFFEVVVVVAADSTLRIGLISVCGTIILFDDDIILHCVVVALTFFRGVVCRVI